MIPKGKAYFGCKYGLSLSSPFTLAFSSFNSLSYNLSTASAKSHFSYISSSLGSTYFLIDKVFFMLIPDLDFYILDTPNFYATEAFASSA